MTKIHSTKHDPEKRWKDIDRRFDDMKKRTEEREKIRNKPVTATGVELILRNQLRALEARLYKAFATKDDLQEVKKKIEGLDNKVTGLDEKMDWLVGKYKGHDEEHILITGRLSENTDRLETVEQRLGIIV